MDGMTQTSKPKSLNTRFPSIKGEPIEPRYIRRAKARGWGWDAAATKPKTEPRAPGPNRHDRRATVKADRLAYQSGEWVRLLGVAIRGMCRRGGFPVVRPSEPMKLSRRQARGFIGDPGKAFVRYLADQMLSPEFAAEFARVKALVDDGIVTDQWAQMQGEDLAYGEGK